MVIHNTSEHVRYAIAALTTLGTIFKWPDVDIAIVQSNR